MVRQRGRWALETAAAFLANEAMRGTKASTISRRVAAIRYIHGLGNQPSPTDHAAVKTTLQGIRRTLGVAPISSIIGHIDFIQVEETAPVHVLDYKPDAPAPTSRLRSSRSMRSLSRASSPA